MSGHLTGDGAANRLTGVRQELKYHLDAAAGPAAMEAMAKRISPKLFDGSDNSFRISIYLDFPDHSLARRGLSHGGQSTKLRVKEYYRIRDRELVSQGRCWLEVKTRAGTMVEKSRFPAARGDVEAILANGPPRTMDRQHWPAMEAFESVRDGRLLSPLFVAHYRRWTFQDSSSSLRVTFDSGITFHLPPLDAIRAGGGICSRDRLPPPIRVEDGWIVEVKSLGLTPRWMDEVLGGRDAVEYSKFVTGVEALAALGRIVAA